MTHGLRTRPAGTDHNGSERRMGKKKRNPYPSFTLSCLIRENPCPKGPVRSPWAISFPSSCGELVAQEPLHLVPHFGRLVEIDPHLPGLAAGFQGGRQRHRDALVQRELMTRPLGQLLFDLGREQE